MNAQHPRATGPRLAIAWLVLASSCMTPARPLARVRVEVKQATLAPLGDGLALSLGFAILNPNQHSLSLSAIDWEIELDDRAVARGRLDFTRTIPPGQPVTLRVSDHVRPGASARYSKRLLGKNAPVRVSAVLHFIGDRADTATNIATPLQAKVDEVEKRQGKP